MMIEQRDEKNGPNYEPCGIPNDPLLKLYLFRHRHGRYFDYP